MRRPWPKGIAASFSVTASRYPDESALPSTATPSAAPSSRVVSFVADPTPARAFETAPMIDSVAGAIARPIPSDMTSSIVANTG
jgi:hypothetical protein